MGYSTVQTTLLDSADNTGTASQRLFLYLLEEMESHEDGVRRGTDTEHLHDFRVAVRRTRALLRYMKPVLPRDVFNIFRDEFAWLGNITGPLRDMDIQIIHFPEILQNIPEEYRTNLQPLYTLLQTQRESEHDLLIEVLNSVRYQHLKHDWGDTLQGSKVSAWQASPACHRPAIITARNAIERQYRKVVNTGGKLHADSPDKAFHKLRKECKRLRYLLELFASLFSASDINSIIKSLKRLQDNLGQYQDLSVQLHTLTGYMDGLRNDEDGKQALPAIEQLVEKIETQKNDLRGEFFGVYSRFMGKKKRRRFKSLVKTD